MRGAEVHRAREGLTIRPRVLKLFLRLADQAGSGPGEHPVTPGHQPNVVAGQFEALSHRTGQAAVRQCAHCSYYLDSPAVHYPVPISGSALVNLCSMRNWLISMEMSRWLELSPDADCRSEAKGRLCGMNGLSEQSSTRLLF